MRMLVAVFLSCIALNPNYAGAAQQYLIEAAMNDEWFIINGEKYQSKLYCLGWDEGEHVVFLDGSPFGACVSATLFNINRRDTCEVWCE